eukprot:TRINITY_DN43185_c0_g1_i1.p1 TRINITY_DN43185_c0_g1~~TRINITY_DN43185_c0_g1_i1.p1  ORF type:complete len:144 (+),score=6.59 TRINITY_DN43185_c0_g1_i1:41-472(+)
MQHSRQISFASFPLELWLLVSVIAGVLWTIAALATWIYKGLVLPYPHGEWGTELIIIICTLGLELIGKSLASRGNLLEFKGPLLISSFTLVVQVGVLVYMLRFQPYVLKLDFYMSTMFLVVKGLSLALLLNQLTALHCISQTL